MIESDLRRVQLIAHAGTDQDGTGIPVNVHIRLHPVPAQMLPALITAALKQGHFRPAVHPTRIDPKRRTEVIAQLIDFQRLFAEQVDNSSDRNQQGAFGVLDHGTQPGKFETTQGKVACRALTWQDPRVGLHRQHPVFGKFEVVVEQSLGWLCTHDFDGRTR